MVQGSMNYFWNDEGGKEKIVQVRSGQMVYSPPGTPHKMVFLEESSFIAIAAKNRSSKDYESDTTRLPEDYFSSQ
jgi:mannose-6-phosphate isomerase-like protein (cupin superfamily)